jgi:hypothetical protein
MFFSQGNLFKAAASKGLLDIQNLFLFFFNTLYEDVYLEFESRDRNLPLEVQRNLHWKTCHDTTGI